MRILLTTHQPLLEEPAGAYVAAVAAGLVERGHTVRVLAVVEQAGDLQLPGTAITCAANGPQSMFPWPVPGFEPTARRSPPIFSELTAAQVDAYRDRLRSALDAEVERFDPHLVHAQHVWLLAHLALEAGVPYVATVWGPELVQARQAPAFARAAQEAAENAGCLLCHRPELQTALVDTFGELETPTQITSADIDAAHIATLVEVYRTVLVNRFGTADRP